MTENIYVVRKESIKIIKEKFNIIPNYIHPCNKNRQDDMKKLGFVSGRDFNKWMIENGIIKSSTEVNYEVLMNTVKNAGYETDREYRDTIAQKLGYKNSSDRHKEYMHDTCRQLSLEDNVDCPVHLGIKGENLLKIFLEDIVFDRVHKTEYKNDKGIDFNCENPKQEFIDRYPHLKLEKFKKYKIQLELRNLLFYGNDNESSKWKYWIDYNRRIDYFILIALDINGDIAHGWIIHKNDNVRKGHSYSNLEAFWNRSGFTITNSNYYIPKFYKYEFKKEDLEKLKIQFQEIEE